MPAANRFRHQSYTDRHPASPVYRVRPESSPEVDSAEFRRRMQAVGDVLREAGVAAIYLVHGSFVGPDVSGVLGEMGRMFPGVAAAISRRVKRFVDRVADDSGNYTEEYARLFEFALQRPRTRRIPVRLFHWSSENHHLGRADAAVRLIEELASLERDQRGRILLWGHSHAGNVFALVTNLLGGNRDEVEEFFRAAEIYYRWPLLGCVDIPVWEQVRRLLQQPDPLGGGVSLDMVTFGTPIRYGWDSGGYSRLLHFIHRRAWEGECDYRAAFPPKLSHVLRASEGDYVQQLGIAGTNVMPSILSWRAWMADRRLSRLLQAPSLPDNPMERFQAGAIVPEEGVTLLADYGPLRGGLAEHCAGHAIYTRKKWLLFHAEETARRLYG
jgi:hypothetical protein